MSETATPRPESAQLDCPECHTSITYYDVEGSEYYACPYCHAYFKYSGEQKAKVLGNYNSPPPPELNLLPIGTAGMLAGQPCRVVGLMERAELARNGKLQYRWLEYQIYQPVTNDYAQLAVFKGHWMIIRPAKRAYRVDDAKTRRASINQPDANYRLYNRYQSRVVWAVGEFDWNIEGDNQISFSEFISPPVMLVQERNKDKETWYRAEHVEPREVATAFGVNVSQMPAQDGVGAVQPDPVKASIPALTLLTGLLLALLLLFQVSAIVRHTPTDVLSADLQVDADTTAKSAPGTGKVIVSPAFTLDHQAALQIDLTTTLNNQWLELPVSLVNEQTGQGFEFTKNIEFYNGVEGGENWSEGSREADAVLSRVPPGRYHLNFYPMTDAGSTGPGIVVHVTADPPLWSNFFIIFFLLMIYPTWQYLRRASHENSRWSESDFAPTSA